MGPHQKYEWKAGLFLPSFLFSTSLFLACHVILWDLSSPTRDGAQIHSTENLLLNPWTNEEFLYFYNLMPI